MQYRLTWRTHLQCLAVSLSVVGIFYGIVSNIIDNFLAREFMLYPTKYILINFYIYAILLLVPVTIFHEGFHGLAYTIFGGKIKWGFKFIYAYTMEVSEKPIERSKFIIVLLLPLFAISLMSLFIGGWLGGMIFLLNFLGSTGDMVMALGLIKYSGSTYIIDRDYGYEVIKNSPC